MKKLLSLIILLSMLFFAFSSYAESGTTVYIREMELSVIIPPEFDYFTRQVKANDPNLKKYGISRDYILSEMESQGDYLVAFADEGETVLEIAKYPTTINDFHSLDDSDLEQVASSFSSQYAQFGITSLETEIYSSPQATFLKMLMQSTNSSDASHIIQYTTSIEGSLINFRIKSYVGAITPSQESALKTIIDSARFFAGSTPQKTVSTNYTDELTGLRFIIPEGWTVFKPEAKEGKGGIVLSSESENNTIVFVSSDLWSSFSDEKKSNYTRADINDSFFLTSEIVDAFSATQSSVNKVAFEGKRFFFIDYGDRIKLVSIENGYLFTFDYDGTKGDKNYNEFESILKSVKYPSSFAEKPSATIKQSATAKPSLGSQASVTHPSPTSSIQAKQNGLGADFASSIKLGAIIGIALWALLPGFIAQKKGRSFLGYYALSWIITPLIATIVILCLRKREMSAEKNEATSEQHEIGLIDEEQKQIIAEKSVCDNVNNQSGHCIQQSTNVAEDIRSEGMSQQNQCNELITEDEESSATELRFCRYCGFKLLVDSEYCSHCGKKVR